MNEVRPWLAQDMLVRISQGKEQVKIGVPEAMHRKPVVAEGTWLRSKKMSM